MPAQQRAGGKSPRSPAIPARPARSACALPKGLATVTFARKETFNDGTIERRRAVLALCHASLPATITMMWFFEREREKLQIDTLYDNAANEFVVTVGWPDGRKQTERFGSTEECRTWLLRLEQTLASQHWVLNGSPVILPHGWPDNPFFSDH